MIKKFVWIMLFATAFGTEAFAGSEWEGVWEYGRYAPAYGGFMNIANCQLNVCDFSIQTFHGAHTCNVNGKLKINGTKGLYYKYLQYQDNGDEQKIVMKLNPEKRVIDVDWQSGRFCGFEGNIGGVYENKQNPLRYQTSFDCWAEGLTEAEKTICASERLAKADREFVQNYPQQVTYLWKKERNACGDDEQCLWKYYTGAIFAAYKAEHSGNFSLYQYVMKQKPEWYFPNDYALLSDYLQNNLTPEDYAAWKITLNDKSNTSKCEECSFMSYSVTGFAHTYASAFYFAEDGMWVAFVSANLPEPENQNIVVYAPQGKTDSDMPSVVKDWISFLKKYYPGGVFMKNLERPKTRIVKRNWYHKPVGETFVKTPEPYASTTENNNFQQKR